MCVGLEGVPASGAPPELLIAVTSPRAGSSANRQDHCTRFESVTAPPFCSLSYMAI